MDYKKLILEFIRSDGKTLALGDGTNWGILTFDGADSPVIEVSSTEKAFGDGSVITNKRIKARDITIVASQRNALETNDLERSNVLSFFNPFMEYTLYASYMGIRRYLKGVVSDRKLPIVRSNMNMELTLSFLAPSPYWLDDTNFGANIAEIKNTFVFPLIFEDTITFSNFVHDQKVDIVNDGDAEMPFNLKIVFNGAVNTPIVYNNNKFIKINYTFKDGDICEIDLNNDSKPEIKINENSALRYVDNKSNLADMLMPLGNATITYDALDGTDYMDVYVYFNKRYLGL